MVTQNNIQLNGDKNICDGLECACEATNLIVEDVGGIGEISLQLCDDCLAKFRE
jgi:hypothetical protein